MSRRRIVRARLDVLIEEELGAGGGNGASGTPPGDASASDRGILTVDASDRRDAAKWSARDWWRFVKLGRRPEPVPSYLGVVEDPEPGKIGIACSGGGIRSAAFSLGALQVLQRRGLMKRASYLAGVSGGSYIAAAFCMVRKTWAPELESAPPHGAPGWDDSDPGLVTDEHPPFERGSPEELYLRNRSSYLAPGAMGKLALLYRLLLGLAINIAFIGVSLVALGLGLALLYGWIFPDVALHVVKPGTCGSAHHHVACDFGPALGTGLWIAIVAIAGFALLLGAGGTVAFRWSESLREFAQTWSLRLLILSTGGAFLLIAMPVLLAALRTAQSAKGSPSVPHPPASTVGAVGASGAVSMIAAVLLQVRAHLADPPHMLQELTRGRRLVKKLGTRLRLLLVYLLAAVAGPLLALALVLAVMPIVLNRDPAVRWIAFGVAAVLLAVGYYFADLTSWSLHPFYRRRLCTAFALKRVRGEGLPPAGSHTEGVAVERDYAKLVPLSQTGFHDGGGKQDWPTLLVCAAANVSDSGATPPGRGVTSFTFSARAMGGPLIGAVDTAEFLRTCDPKRWSDFTLPAAVAMSGAALSPSMGKMTKRPFTFLMALANVRLGVWVPNPRRVDVFRTSGAPAGGQARDPEVKRFLPRPRPSYLFRELFGWNNLNARFLYVTDGGHYENLGLVELLRRGCMQVYCFDASGGSSFAALGDAVALARSELGVEIDIDPRPLVPVGERNLAPADCVHGTIVYPGVDTPGTLVYSRTVMTADAPWDVHAYHEADHTFPHDSTADQLYTDQKFEAYRALGECAGGNAIQAMELARAELGLGPDAAGEDGRPADPRLPREPAET